MKLNKTEKHNRTLLAVDLPAIVANLSNDYPELEIAINYTGESSGNKAIVLDNYVVPAIVRAVNSHSGLLQGLEEAWALLGDSRIRFKICDGGRGNLGEQSAYMRALRTMRAAIKVAVTGKPL